MTELLHNHLGGRWQAGEGPGTTLRDPVLGTDLVRVSSDGLDLAAGFAFARDTGGAALRALTYRQRAALLGEVGKVLAANKAAYYEIATANSGTTQKDSGVDIEGALFTLGQYARWGDTLGNARFLLDGPAVPLSKDGVFRSQHLLAPTRGLALFINAFNFPAWGVWEKAGPALLSGVPVVVKPATVTAWLTQRMVHDVVEAGVLPAGALSIVCGGSAGLLDALQPFDVVSFTGSADTAALLRRHPAFAERSVRLNVEADSLNSALLAPDATPGSAAFELLVGEVAREMTVKSGQKCTAIRRVFVPEALYGAVGEAVAAKLRTTTVGNPRHDGVRMGSLVGRAQWQSVQDGLARLMGQSQALFDGRDVPLVDADPAVAACIGPVLLGCTTPDEADAVHRTEVFGPVATLMSYRSVEQAQALIRRGEGSLVVSVVAEDPAFVGEAALSLADSHGRVHGLTAEVAARHTGHGNVMPQSLHGGPGRAGGGEELGGLRALGFYHRRSAVQAGESALAALAAQAAALPQ
ncbi:3,4-dehydroadipyl-CoA semialdehyde dehydrogenase [Aquabacterium sp. J223]|uniref:3,4-dehydroadipyl-CoA semialdehyde dehydrogenase n=1 Tax=Aquabacterium sp. J223 TaxID=2898431 RepID=UPI0021AE117A|nr:3,4-dehydroadipyl-CoA semialdehyde dehydrogenase [Aquabacterium sp. J223]UUX94391.1 3,4-dehydroadipyl-CoA semialdehyde dehydrogenase [Aquabacterium sp. J223]